MCVQSIFFRSLDISVAFSKSLCSFPVVFPGMDMSTDTPVCKGSITRTFHRGGSSSLLPLLDRHLFVPQGSCELCQPEDQRGNSSSFCPNTHHFCKILVTDSRWDSRRNPSRPLSPNSAQSSLGMAPAHPPAPLPFENSYSVPQWFCSAILLVSLLKPLLPQKPCVTRY